MGFSGRGGPGRGRGGRGDGRGGRGGRGGGGRFFDQGPPAQVIGTIFTTFSQINITRTINYACG